MEGNQLKKLMLAPVAAVLLATSGAGLTEDMFRCLNNKGRPVFTDNERLCKGFTNEPEISKVNVKLENIHSQYGTTVSEEYYNYAYRAYRTVPGYSIDVIAEKQLIDNEPTLLSAAIKKLEKADAKAMAAFPAGVSNQFSEIKYYIFSGGESRTGGRKGGQWYFRKGNGISSSFDDSVVVRSAKDYLKYSDERAAQTAIHELSHAYYYYHRKRLYWSVRRAFENAEAQRLYLNVPHVNGGTIKKGYAATSAREYFAELSKMYFLDNYYYPYRASELQQYDPMGYRMVEMAYGVSQ